MSGNGNGNGNGNAVATLSDDLVAKARAIASRSDDLLELLDDARLRLLDPDRKRPTRPEPERTPEPELPPAEVVEPEPAREGSDVSDGLRVLTTQMSVAGADRDEIAARLRAEFGVADAEPILRSLGL
jgi:hypothetical protein